MSASEHERPLAGAAFEQLVEAPSRCRPRKRVLLIELLYTGRRHEQLEPSEEAPDERP